MTTATETSWLALQDIPPRPSEADLLAFFGIPPDPRDKLDDNIRKKRQYWNAKTSGPAGRDRAKRIKAKIIEVERAIKRGAAASGDGPQDGGGGAGTTFEMDPTMGPADLWRVAQELVFADRFDEARDLAVAAINRWRENQIPHAVFAWVVAVATETGAFVTEGEAQSALRSADWALGVEPRDTVTWTSKTLLQLYGGEFDAALATMAQAERVLGSLEPQLRVARMVVYLHQGRYEEPLAEAILAVDQSNYDEAIRSRCTVLLVRQFLPRLLPIDDAARLAAYVEAVNVIAWCADGVPEAEDLVRPHRMWAQLASGTTFAGGYILRSFLATLTGLLTLPLSNAAKSKPVWRVFLDGPEKHDAWAFLGYKDFVFHVHAPVVARLPWTWPDPESVADG